MRILILGASGHGRVIAGAIEASGEHHLVGFVDVRYPDELALLARPLLGSDSDIGKIITEHSIEGVVVAIGDNWMRAKVVRRLARDLPAIAFPAVVHPTAIVADGVTIGEGSLVMAGAILNPGVAVGDHAIVNTGACVDHDSSLSSFSSFAPGAVCGGNVSVGEFTAIGIGATLIHGVTVGTHVVLGAGAVALRDIPDLSVAFGVPARIHRRREQGDPYL